MNTRFLFQGLTLDSRTEEYIRKRLSKIDKHVEKATTYSVELDLDKKGKFRVEIMVKTPHHLYRAEERTESIEGSTDLAIDEILAQVVKQKSKKRDLKRRGARSFKKKIVVDVAARF